MFEQITKLKFVSKFLEAFPKANLYLVGGTLRDAFLGIESNDFDLVAENIDQDELVNFLENEGHVVSVEGRAFGVIKFRPADFEFNLDIALPRKEWYEAGKRRKHAEVETAGMTILDDLARRDFTINAMAIDLRSISTKYEAPNTKSPPSAGSRQNAGQISTLNQSLNKLDIEKLDIVSDFDIRISDFLIDPFSGLNDLQARLIRAVGTPTDRFLEDPTRILRGIRFAVQLDFAIEENTWQAMRKLSIEVTRKFTGEDGIEYSRVAPEMIGSEFLKAFKINPVKTIRLYDEAGLLSELFPEITAMKGVPQPINFHSEGDVFAHTMLALEKLRPESTLIAKLGTLLHDIGKVTTYQTAEQTGDRIRFSNHDKVGAEKSKEIVRRLKFTSQLQDDVAWLVKNHMRMLLDFPKMRKDKQKALARNPLFYDLLDLSKADASASVRPDGSIDLSFLDTASQILAELKKDEEAGKPREIINGSEIIAILKGLNRHFDPQKEGKTVGELKNEVNSLYDRGEIESKEEAVETVKKLGRNKLESTPEGEKS